MTANYGTNQPVYQNCCENVISYLSEEYPEKPNRDLMGSDLPTCVEI